jgi:N-acetylmuramoyl-L-alanine amidase
MVSAALCGLTACTGVRPELLVGETIPPPSTVAALEVPTTTQAPLVPEAKAVISPTGIVLAVREVRDDGYVVTTPCSEEGFLVWGTPISEAQVVLDPGHGGDESGASGRNGLTEKDLNLRVVKRTSALLTSRGISNVLTRTADYRVPLRVRAEIANTLEADVLVSVHHNAPQLGNSDGPGTEIFVQSNSRESRRLGGVIYERTIAQLEQFDIQWVSARDAGVIEVRNTDGEDSYGMIRRPEVPAVLVELGYIANPAEATLFDTPEYIEAAAIGLADGIETYLTFDADGTGYRDTPRIFNPKGGTGGISGCVDPPLE